MEKKVPAGMALLFSVLAVTQLYLVVGLFNETAHVTDSAYASLTASMRPGRAESFRDAYLKRPMRLKDVRAVPTKATTR